MWVLASWFWLTNADHIIIRKQPSFLIIYFYYRYVLSSFHVALISNPLCWEDFEQRQYKKELQINEDVIVSLGYLCLIYIHIKMIFRSHRDAMYNRLYQFSSSDNMSRLIQLFTVHLQFVYCSLSGEIDSF